MGSVLTEPLRLPCEVGHSGMLSGPHQKFAEGIAAGLNGTAAYQAAYPKVKASTARSNGSELLTKTDIQAEVERIRAEAKEKPASAVLTLADKLEFLAKVAGAKPNEAGPDNPLCEVKMSKAGPYYAFPDKIRSMELHAKLSGELKDKTGSDGTLEIHVTIGT